MSTLMCWRWCCPQQSDPETEEPFLHARDTYQGGGKQLTTGERVPLSHDSEDPQNNQDSFDCPTDTEDDAQIFSEVNEFLRKFEPNAPLRSLYERQFTKLLKRRRFRRTMVYLGRRKDLSDYKNHILERIRGMVEDLDPKPDKDKVELVLKAMVALILDPDIRKQIIASVNNHMSAE